MIAIVNVSECPSSTGEQTYELRINERVLARFTHIREHGLTECLRKAIVLAEHWERLEKQEMERQKYLDNILRQAEIMAWGKPGI